MRFSKLYAPTLREIPADAEIKSQELLQRGAFVRKIASGIYTFLPLGFKVLKKVEQIVREEMNNIGAQELLMPILQPAELWKQTGRWDDYGPEMMKLKDRHERDFTLGPTHEEMITYIVKNELNSYKQLPISLYQIAPKYRDEIRPRFGVLRAREFIMKDAYSFHESQESLDKTYQDFYNAYKKIMERLGVDYMIVEADTGAIGGNVSHEFHVKAKAGETTIFYCDNCGYAASDEKAESSLEFQTPDEQEKELNLVDTPNVRRIEEVASFLNVEIKKIIKSILYKGVNGWVLALIRGDYEINEAKLKSLLRDQTLELAQPEQVKEKFGVSIGFIGPVGIDDVKVVADFSVKSVKNAVVGGMKEDKHYINANEGRDFKVELWGDIRMINVGEPCPKCGKNLKITKGIELGQVFKLGTKYSDSMQAYYNDEKGERKPFVMGCYGWGISRTLGAVVEQLHDENGILWPLSIAPFEIDVIAVNMKDQNQIETAEKIYKKLKELNYDVLFDDREVSPGVKFKDADLIGIPLKIIVGKALKESKVELKLRYEKEGKKVEITEELKELVDAVEQKLKEYDPRKILKDID